MLYICCVLAAAILLAVGAWKCVDDACALTAEDRAVTVIVSEGSTMSDITKMMKDNHHSKSKSKQLLLKITSTQTNLLMKKQEQITC